MRLSAPRLPHYRHYKPKNLAVVRIRGRDYYLGRYGSAESWQRYRLLVAEWLARGEPSPEQADTTALAAPSEPGFPPTTLRIEELVLRYWRFSERYYQKDGRPTREVSCIREALRRVLRLFASAPATEFGPRALKLVRDEFVRDNLCRGVINQHVGRIKRMFKWAVEHELVPVQVYQALATVGGLRRGRSEAREAAPVLPVEAAAVEAVLPFLPAQVRAMVEIQRLTGCRPSEICILRPCDVDRSENDVWIYTPESHKTEHHGRHRTIFLGPVAQRLLEPWLSRPPNDYCFSPAESRRQFDERRRSQRKSPRTPSQEAREPKTRAKKRPGVRYNASSYRQAIVRGCRQAKIPAWSPNQLRHACATQIRRVFGLEASQTVLGHSRADVTQIYAERDLQLARNVMAKQG